MQSTGSRKGQTSITHLMNFSLPPRPVNYPPANNYNRHSSRKPTWGVGSGYHAVDKARSVLFVQLMVRSTTDRLRYVHANYRFVVDPRHDYNVQRTDADVHLDWSTVLQILVSPQSQASACPICLGDPVAPRMAKCGHIFCMHCLIRYMHSADHAEQLPERRARWKKCPICYDSIYISETRPVRWYIGQEPPIPLEGGDVVLRLVLRAAGSTLALPREGRPTHEKHNEVPWHFAADVMDYARVMKGTEDYMREEYDREIDELEQTEKHDELMFGEGSEWTGRAIRAVKEAKEKIRGLGNAPKVLSKALAQKSKPAHVMSSDPDIEDMQSVPESWDEESSGGASLPVEDSTSVDGNGHMKGRRFTNDEMKAALVSSTLSMSLAQLRSQQSASSSASSAPTDYYFYQALLHYYLAPLDIRILRAAFGEFTNFPSTILPRVERISTGHVVDDEMRKRAKYLAHLPHGCEINLLECDWTDTVPADILESFKADIERRRKKNSDKEAREEKERVRAEKEEDDKRWAAARRRRPSSEGEQHFRPGDFQPLGIPDISESGASVGSGFESSSPMWASRGGQGSGFASLASPGTSPMAVRTVWGTAAHVPQSPDLAPLVQESNTADDGWLHGWEKELTLENDLIAQFEAASLAGESSSSAGAAAAAAAVAVKKKKGKKITLMSTNVRRGA